MQIAEHHDNDLNAIFNRKIATVTHEVMHLVILGLCQSGCRAP